jgi:hypothetical protein
MSRQAFNDLVLKHFAFLRDGYGFVARIEGPEHVVFETGLCQVTVAFDRRDLIVDIHSREEQIINRVRCSLYELVKLKDSAMLRSLPPPPEGLTLEGWLQNAAELLEKYGSDMLSGDFSIRGQVAIQKAEQWLELWEDELFGLHPYPNIEDGWRELRWDYDRRSVEMKKAIWKVLEGWLESNEARRAKFAEAVLLRL